MIDSTLEDLYEAVGMYPNRTLCAVLEEMRQCYKTRNFAPLLGLIEEAQSMANRMEAALEDINDIDRYRVERSQLSKQVKKLKTERNELIEEKNG